MQISVRNAVKDDMVDVIRLINELASFEKEANAVEVDINQLIQRGKAQFYI